MMQCGHIEMLRWNEILKVLLICEPQLDSVSFGKPSHLWPEVDLHRFNNCTWYVMELGFNI